MRISVKWDTSITESYHVTMDYEEFAAALRARGEDVPSEEDLRAAALNQDAPSADWSDAGSDFEDADPAYVSVGGRTITAVTLLAAEKKKPLSTVSKRSYLAPQNTLTRLYWAPYQESGIPDPAKRTIEPPAWPVVIQATGCEWRDLTRTAENIIIYWKRPDSST